MTDKCFGCKINSGDFMKYYSEEPLKDFSCRSNYAKGIDEFLESERKKADERRKSFFSVEEYVRNPEKFRQAFVELLGFPLGEKRSEDITAEKTFVANDGNVNIYRTVMQIGKIPFYGICFEQVVKSDETPFAIVIHGGEGTPEMAGSINFDSSNYNHMARRLTERGCNVFCPQLLLWNYLVYGSEYSRDDVHGRLTMLGGSVTALEMYLLSQCIDYFVETEGENSDKIGVTGLSYGGQFALDLAAYDCRIKVCHAAGQFNSRYRYPESDWCYFNALNKISDAEKAALVCPRALCISVGDDDYLFDSAPAVEESKRVREFYSAFGADDKFDFYVFGGSHETDKSDRWVDFMMNNF